MRLGSAEGSSRAQAPVGSSAKKSINRGAIDAASTSGRLTKGRPPIRLRINNEQRDEVGLLPA